MKFDNVYCDSTFLFLIVVFYMFWLSIKLAYVWFTLFIFSKALQFSGSFFPSSFYSLISVMRLIVFLFLLAVCLNCSYFSVTLRCIIMFLSSSYFVKMKIFTSLYFLYWTSFIVSHKYWCTTNSRNCLISSLIFSMTQWLSLISICLHNFCSFFCYWYLLASHCNLIVCIVKFLFFCIYLVVLY